MRHQEWINDLDESTQLLIIKKHHRAIRQLYKPSFKIVKYVVDTDPDAITTDCELDEPSQIYFMNQVPALFNRISNPTQEVIDLAIKLDPRNILDVKDPTVDQHFSALSQMPGLVSFYPELFPDVDPEIITYARMII